MLRVTPIYGSRWSSEGQAEAPECTLVEFSNCRILWNVGWFPVSFDDQKEDSEASHAFPELPEHDCLILTSSTLQAAGGLPMYHKQMQARSEQSGALMPPVYATFPTVKMGQMTLYDQHAAICMDGGKPDYTLEDLDSVFGAVHSIKYSQSITVHDPTTLLPCLQVTAHRAGSVVGGAFYTLKRTQDETVVVLTSTYHIARELHLDSSPLLRHATAADVLVTHPGGPSFYQCKALAHPPPSGGKPPLPPQLVTQAERNLTETVLSVLRRDGNVLLPVDAAGRVLELVLLLNQEWEKQRLSGSYNLCWLGPMVHNTAEFARCQLEWMALNLGKQFDTQARHPLKLDQMHFCASLTELQTFMETTNQNPTCVIAAGLSLESGPARDVLLQWADNPDNAIIFTDSSQCYLRKWRATSSAMEPNSSSAIESVTMTSAEQVPGSAPESTKLEPIEGATTTADTDMVDNEDSDDDEDLFQTSAAVVIDEDEQSSPWTTAAQLLAAWAQAQFENKEMDDVVVIDVNTPQRAPLAGAELKAFLELEESARLKEKEAQEKRDMLREVEIAKGQLRLGEQNESTKTTGATTTNTSALSTSNRPRKKSRFDSTLFLKFSKPLHLMFEIREEAVGIAQTDSTAKYGIGESVGRSGEVMEDDYGISVIPEKFVDIVSGVDPSKFAGGSGRIGEEVAKRGLGYGTDNLRSSSKSGGPARVAEDDDVNEGEMDEQAMEAVDLSEGTGIIRGRSGRQPTKVTTIRKKLEVLAEVSFVPLEGRVDARAARQSVRALQPRRVVVLGGPANGASVPENLSDEVSALAEAVKSFAFARDKEVPTPSDGECIALNVGHAAFGARLLDTPYQTAEEKEASEEPPEPIEPMETKLGACTVSLLDAVATGQKVAADQSIVMAPRPISSAPKSDAPSVYLSDGDLLLTDLRAELIGQGMKADYSTQQGYSQLVVNGRVLVRKEQASGKVHVEGPLCEDFFKVRAVVCGQYVVL